MPNLRRFSATPKHMAAHRQSTLGKRLRSKMKRGATPKKKSPLGQFKSQLAKASPKPLGGASPKPLHKKFGG